MLEKLRGRNTRETNKKENNVNPHKGTTPPSTKNLKALGLWVFFLICFSTFSFHLNVGPRLTPRYLTISPSSERVPLLHWYTPPRAEAFSNPSTSLTKDSHLYRCLHTEMGHTCLNPLSGRLLIQGSNCTRLSWSLLRKLRGEILGRLNKNEN